MPERITNRRIAPARHHGPVACAALGLLIGAPPIAADEPQSDAEQGATPGVATEVNHVDTFLGHTKVIALNIHMLLFWAGSKPYW